MTTMNRMMGGILVLIFGSLLYYSIEYLFYYPFNYISHYTGADFYLEFYLIALGLITIIIGGILLIANQKAGSILAIICATIFIVYYFVKMGLYYTDHTFPTLSLEEIGVYIIDYIILQNLYLILVIVGAILGLRREKESV